MTSYSRVVLDTNVVVSALAAFNSTPGQAVRWVLRNTAPLASTATILELEEVLRRPKLTKLISLSTIDEFWTSYRKTLQLIQVSSSIRACRACRDPRDDKFLQVAVDGHADLIVTGDEDLLSLDPFQGIRILTPSAFLAAFGAPSIEPDPG